VNLTELQPGIKNDALTLLCGAKLGAGVYRTVFEYLPNETDCVVKIEDGRSFHNVTEWHVWQSAKGLKGINQWFAPCIRISSYSCFLLMTRTIPVTLAELRKNVPKVPLHFTDLKAGNWGRIGKRYVCHDYANNLIDVHGLSTRMKIAKWWE